MEVHHCLSLILAVNYVVKLHNQPADLTPPTVQTATTSGLYPFDGHASAFNAIRLGQQRGVHTEV